MVGPDLPGLVCVRRIDDARAREWSRSRGQGGANSAEAADESHLAVRRVDGAEVAVRAYARLMATERDRLRFEQEAGALKALADVAHVVAVHDAGVTDEGRAYVVTDFCAAGSLYDHLVTVGRFTPVEGRRIGAKLAGALAQAHRRGIFHRNLKPANVLIDAAGEPALTDFGLVAMAISDGDFMPPLHPKPRPFVAPEAYLPELMSVAADIFALGATLYALLAGWAPRTADPLTVAADGESVADLPRVPWALMSVVRRAMAIDPEDRFPDASQFGAALAAV